MNITKYNNADTECINHFLSLKKTFKEQRQHLEYIWEQAWQAYLVTKKLDSVYRDRADIKVPIMMWKVNGITARIMRVVFNAVPFARIESKYKNDPMQEDVVDLWNKYIFDYQLNEINFKQNYKVFTRSKVVLGTSFAKMTQEYEEEAFSYFDEEVQAAKDEVLKDNTFFRPILINEFFSDVNSPNINDSPACIHSTVLTLDEIRRNRKRTVSIQSEQRNAAGEVVAIIENDVEQGIYENVELLDGNGTQLTEEQQSYMQMLGFTPKQVSSFQKMTKETKKNGYVQIDECWGKYDLDGDGFSEECVFVIANGLVLIRKEPSPFKHKKYKRPFIRGVYTEIQNCLYGQSPLIASLSLLMELNASRSQATDARTRAVAPMWFQNSNVNIVWDGIWTPNKIIPGNSSNSPFTPIISPDLQSVTINDSLVIQRDIDQTFSLSPVQEGTSDNRLIPDTARGTQSVIGQNDININDVIDTAIDNEVKPIIEILYERNLQFKSPMDLLVVESKDKIQSLGITEDTQMKELAFDATISVMGNVELSNELSHQQGYLSFINVAQNTPPIAGRLNWTVIGDKLLRAFGIKDDAEDIWISEEKYQQGQAAQQQAEQQQMQAQVAQQEEIYRRKVEIDTESKMAIETAKASTELVKEHSKKIEAKDDKKKDNKK